MARETIRDWVRSVERAEPTEQWVMLCFFAGRDVPVDDDELNGAIRRAELLLAAGGDPRRTLDPFGRAAESLADDLDAPDRRALLRAGLEALRADVTGLRGARESLALLLSDPDLAWRAYATSLLAEALAEGDI
ncbi:MAG TPA: hypothetical protein VFO26_15875 [Gaiella sp.]|uniref:hypothetical protein n=1 Tax=Gaiella sp. TaxID=2663207 RepID=UPI002D8108BD|nr:hypothetical protein [Gaiella sp.]HET9289032.1 hypothetical protein [Gaiella sp.]